MNNRVSELVCQKIYDLNVDQSFMVKSLWHLLWKDIFSYHLNEEMFSTKLRNNISDQYFQEQLSLISEYNEGKKWKWSYYTQKDICEYIIKQSILLRYWKKLLVNEKYETNYENFIDKLDKIDDILYNAKFFDPTCWAWQFMIETFNVKIWILKTIKKDFTDNDVIKIVNTIFWNDYDWTAIEICKLRLFFSFIEHIKNKGNYEIISKIINSNLYNEDYIQSYYNIDWKYDFIIWNPPYVEYSKYDWKTNNSYWNVYADVLENSMKHLKTWWILWFIIPISYISTPRMSKIRFKIEKFSKYEYILSFADRPDCLFKWVHQKLNILLAKQWDENCEIFTSNYNYRYKQERNYIFSRLKIIKNDFKFDGYLAKIWTEEEYDILKKIVCQNDKKCKSLYDLQCEQWKSLYVGMRAAFWIKAFSFNPWSNEYKEFKYDENIYYFVLCLLNSSLFWLYWVIMSDCWHITQKEFKWIKIPDATIKNTDVFKSLYIKLEKQLEETKEYVWTKQTEYEYKHKKCKDFIDEIDNEIWKVYWLSDDEIEYVKWFALNYR